MPFFWWGNSEKEIFLFKRLVRVTEPFVNQMRPVKIREVPQVLPGDQVPGHNENLAAGQFVLNMPETFSS